MIQNNPQAPEVALVTVVTVALETVTKTEGTSTDEPLLFPLK